MFQRMRVAIRSRHSRAAVIPMASAKPRGSRLAWFWHGLGQDNEGLIYLAIGDAREMRGGCGNVYFFQYDPASGHKRYLDSVREILARADNLAPNRYWPHSEGVAKVHTDIVEHKGLLYFATHDMHHPKNLRAHRGGHFMSFDRVSEQFRVLSAHCPNGVAIENEGIIALNVLRDEDLLVGWTYPYGRVLLFDLESGELQRFGRFPEVELITNISRVVAVTPAGSIIVSYTGPNASSHFYKLARDQGRLVPMDYEHDLGFFEGLAQTSDGAQLFVVDTNGQLYVIDTATDHIVGLGSILPPQQEAAGENVLQLRNLTLSPDDSKLFFVPTRVTGGDGAYHLYEYEIASGSKRKVADLRPVLQDAMLTGNGVLDERGRMYLSCYFGSDGRMYRQYGELSGLARIDLSDRLDRTANAKAESVTSDVLEI